MSGEINVLFIVLLNVHSIALTARSASFVEGKSVNSPEMPPSSPAALLLPGEVNAIKHCVRCNGGLAKMSG